MKSTCFIISLLFLSHLAFGQLDSGYQITVTFDDYQSDTLLLGHHYGNQQYLKDTAYRAENGQFVFEGNSDLEGGVYLLVLKPDNNFLQLLINPGERVISLEAKNTAQPELVSITGSDDNILFKDYLQLIQKHSPIAQQIRDSINQLTQQGQDVSALQSRIQKINDLVKGSQEELLENHPESLTTLLIKGSLNPEIPEFEGTQEEVESKRFQYFKEHYFDNVNLQDPRILRTPFLFNKIDQYIQRYTPKVPDSINAALDLIFNKLEGNEEASKYYLIHYLNYFAKSEFVGMDAIYVHLVNQYYDQGKAPWLEEKQLKKIVDNAKRLQPLLIGKKAPDLKMRLQDETYVSIYDTDCEYMVLFFWEPDCPHCKKQIPDMVKFYEEYKDEDIKVFAICSKLNTTKEPEGGAKCWEYIQEKPEMADWIHVADPFHLTRYKIIYDLKTTPQIFVLDRNKIIRSKRIGAEQLNDVMDHIYLQDGKKVEDKSDTGK